MRNTFFLFVVLLLGLVSCKKDETTQPVVTAYDNANAVSGGI